MTHTRPERRPGLIGAVRASGDTQPDLDPEQRARAVRTVASLAHNAHDCAHLLDALGLHPAEGKNHTPEHHP